MMPRYINIPTFDPVPLRPNPTTAMYPSAAPMQIEAVGPNDVKMTIGEVCRVVDGVTLADVVNGCLQDYRRRYR